MNNIVFYECIKYFFILSLMSFIHNTDNHKYGVLNICCNDFPPKTSWGKNEPTSVIARRGLARVMVGQVNTF